MLVKEILFEPSTPYFEEKKSIFEQDNQTLIDSLKSTIIAEHIQDKIWAKVLLVYNFCF